MSDGWDDPTVDVPRRGSEAHTQDAPRRATEERTHDAPRRAAGEAATADVPAAGAGGRGGRGGGGAGPAGSRGQLLGLPPELVADYEVLQDGPRLPGGGEAWLFPVRHRESDEVRVVKIYNANHRLDTESLGLIRDEGEWDHTVRLFGFGMWEDRPWEVLEYVRGGTLRERMARLGRHDDGAPVDETPLAPLPADEVRTVFDELYPAIRWFHDRGILHRDIKPTNIFVRAEDPLDLVIGDFGLATVLDAAERVTEHPGTFTYAAPELHLAQTVTPKSDFWSLGMILLECLTGANPFKGLSNSAINRVLMSGRPMDVSAVADDRLRLLCDGLLTIRDADRWGAAEIDAWREGASPAVRHGAAPAVDQPAWTYVFDDARYSDFPSLALAMASHWSQARAELARNIDRFGSEENPWGRDDIAQQARSIRDEDPDVRLLRFLLFVHPSLPPVFRGRSIDGKDLAGLANDAIGGDTEAQAVVTALFDHDVLQVYGERVDDPRIDGGALVRLDRDWHLEFRAASRSLSDLQRGGIRMRLPEALQIGDAVEGTVEIDLANDQVPRLQAVVLRLAAGDRSVVDEQRDRLRRALAGDAGRCPWYRAMGDVRTAGPGQLAAMLLVEPFAVERGAIIRADQESAAEERREQRREANVRARRDALVDAFFAGLFWSLFVAPLVVLAGESGVFGRAGGVVLGAAAAVFCIGWQLAFAAADPVGFALSFVDVATDVGRRRRLVRIASFVVAVVVAIYVFAALGDATATSGWAPTEASFIGATVVFLVRRVGILLYQRRLALDVPT